MAHLVKKKRYLGCLWELETVTLPGGAPTTDFQHWRISFGMQKPRSSKTKVLRGITKEAIEADRSGGYLHKRLLQACAPQNLYGQDYYYLEYRMISASRGAAAPSRHRRDSCPSHEVVAGFFFEFEAVRTEASDRDAPRRHARGSLHC